MIQFRQSFPLLALAADRQSPVSALVEQQEQIMNIERIDARGIISVDRSSGIITINLDAMKGMSPEERFQAMIGAGRYKSVNPDITADRLLASNWFEGTGPKMFLPKVFSFDRDFLSQTAVEKMKEENFRPSGHLHTFGCGAAFADEQFDEPILCLDSIVSLDGILAAVCLGFRRRGIGLWDFRRGALWPRRYRALGVQEIPT
jgi:hypothetical protein